MSGLTDITLILDGYMGIQNISLPMLQTGIKQILDIQDLINYLQSINKSTENTNHQKQITTKQIVKLLHKPFKPYRNTKTVLK